MYSLLICLDMTDLAAIGALPRRSSHFLGRRLGRSVSAAATTTASAGVSLKHLLLLLALVPAFFVLFEAFTLFLDAT